MQRLILLVALCLLVSGAMAAYGNYTSFNYNITAGMGTQTNYQVKFILSNASGVSGYYAPDNIIYTNGTTRADWYDVNATDGSNNPLPFWIENNTQTAKNCTAWVNVPSIAVGNTSTGRWYYGDVAQSASTMNGYNTFQFFDDFSGSSYNTSQWMKSAGITATVSGGLVHISTSTSAAQGLYSNTSTISVVNTSTIARMNTSAYGSTSYDSALFTNDVSPPVAGNFMGAEFDSTTAGYAGYYRNKNTGSNNASIMSGWTANTMHIFTEFYNTSAMVGSVDGSNIVYNTGQYYSTNGGVTFYQSSSGAGPHTYVDWIFVSKTVNIPPITSLYSTMGNAGSISASFIQSPNPSSVGQSVSFTDTSTGSPTTWNWSLTGAAPTNTTQNATYTYSTPGAYNIFLNVTNATGSWSNTSQTHTVSSQFSKIIYYWERIS